MISTDEINPIDYYNRKHADEAFEVLLKVKAVQRTGIDSLAYVANKGDETKKMILIKDGFFRATCDNGLGWRKGDIWTPFMILQRYKYKNNFEHAMFYVKTKHMEIEADYIRVGIRYMKKSWSIDRYGIKRTFLNPWDRATVVEDHGKEVVSLINKFDSFVIEPNNKEYSPIINNNYNLYAEFSHRPCAEGEYDELKWYWIKTLLEHIFGEQYEQGLVYLKTMYDHPKQALPILVLISEERQTGKSTFVDLLTILFGDNMVVVNPQDISSSFNGSYASKNIIAIEESRFDNVATTEKLKNLATQKKILSNNKYMVPVSLPFYGKLIITSNDENKFSKVDNQEIRYWVRKVPSLKGKENHNILDDMKDEIPYFLYHLDTLKDIDISASRMVLKAKDITTDALSKVKSESLPGLHKDISFMLDEHCANNIDVEEVLFTAQNIKNKWFDRNGNIEINYINRILKDSMRLDRLKMRRFVPIAEQGVGIGKKMSGRPFVFKNPYYGKTIANETF